MAAPLSPEQRAAYQQHGYLVIDDLISPDEVAALVERVRAYTHGDRPAHELNIQVEPRVLRGEARVAQWGDGLRVIERLVANDELFRALCLHPNIVAVVTSILGPDVKLFRDTLMVKPPEIGSQKGWHQDSPYWPIAPMAMCSLWLALDEATLENGCMWIQPGRHDRALPHVPVTDDFVIAEDAVEAERGVAVPLRPGGALFFHSLMPHHTAANRTSRWRRAMAFTYMSARSRYTGPFHSPTYFHVCGQSHPGCVE